MTMYRHIFVCPQCDELAAFDDSKKVSKNATFEASCSCGITWHKFYKTRRLEKNETLE